MQNQKFVNKAELCPERLSEPPEKERRTPVDARLLKCDNTGSEESTVSQRFAAKPALLIQACCAPPDNEGHKPRIGLFEPACGGLAITSKTADLVPQFNGLPCVRLKLRCRRCKTRIRQFANPDPASSWRHVWVCRCIIGWGTGPLTRAYWRATVAAVCAIGFVAGGFDVTPGRENRGFGSN
jgi:hypothetical protein